MSYGYLRISRSLFDHPSYLSAPPAYCKVLTILLNRACFTDWTYNDHGVNISLKPGQMCCTIRELAEWADIPKTTVSRAVSRFLKDEILVQEVGHTKCIFTISTKYLLQDRGTTFGTKAGQDRDTKEESKKERKEIKETISKEPQAASIVPSSFLLSERTEEEVKDFEEVAMIQGFAFQRHVLVRWIKQWGIGYLNDIFVLLVKEVGLCESNPKKKPIRKPEAWMQTAGDRNYIEMGEIAQKNMELARKLRQNGWPNLEVRSRHAGDPTTGKEYYYNHVSFEKMIMFEYERIKVG